ncbi:MAG: uroporphyrinogen-III synthase [Gammaproteobacteria bacterium]
MKLWLNRLPSAFPRVAEAFVDTGFEVIALPCVQSYPLDVALDPAIVDFDRFDHVVVTSPESARLLIDAVLSRWAQWPAEQQFWAVGLGTAEVLRSELHLVRTAASPGSESLIELMRTAIRPEDRLLIVSGKGSGRQFSELNSLLLDPVVHLELFELVLDIDLDLQNLNGIGGIVHGSAALLDAFLQLADARGLNALDYVHFVTSSDAKAQLPSGSRYYQMNSPTPDEVRLAMQGEPSVKD